MSLAQKPKSAGRDQDSVPNPEGEISLHTDFDPSLGVQQHVVGLDITMDDALQVQVA